MSTVLGMYFVFSSRCFWRNLHHWQKYYTAGSVGMDKSHLWQVEGAFGQKSPFHMIRNEISSIFLVCIVLESDLRKCSLSPLNLENGPCRERLLPPERNLRGCVIFKPEFQNRLAPPSFGTDFPDIEDHCLAACKRQSRS